LFDIYAVPKGYEIHSRQMLDYYKQLYRVRESLAQLRRHLRLCLAGGDRLDASCVSRTRRRGFLSVHDYWRYIDRNRESVAVTGSLALAAFGLVDKRIINVDLVHLRGVLSGDPPGSVETRIWPESGHQVVGSAGYNFEDPHRILLRKVDMSIADPAQDKHLDDIMQAAERLGIWPQ
jgi:hypothetical protein